MNAVRWTLSLAIVAGGSCTSAALPVSDPPPSQPSAPAIVPVHEPELGVERALVDEAQAAFDTGDLERARRSAGGAVDALLARPASDRSLPWIQLLARSGSKAYDAGDLGTAHRAWTVVYAERLERLPADHPDVQLVMLNLSATMYLLGDLEGARAICERLLEIRTRTLPDDHPDVQEVRENLAMTLRGLGELERAEQMFEKVLETAERSLPPDHPKLQAARRNLGSTLCALGDFVRARSLLEEVLAAQSRTLSDDDPELQYTRSNLAVTMRELGEVWGARSLEEKVLEVFSRTLPEDHVDRLRAMENLGVTLYALGDVQGARALQEQVLERRSRILPEDHPDLQVSRSDLALYIQALGDLDGARVLFEQVLEVDARTLPEDHFELQRARQNVGRVRYMAGDYEAALELFEQVAEGRSRALPEEHLELQMARENVAVALFSLGKLAEARGIQEQVLDVRTRSLPADHRDLQMARLNLTGTLFAIASGAPSADPEELPAARERIVAVARDLVRADTDLARRIVRSATAREAEERCEHMSADQGVAITLALGTETFAPLHELEGDVFAFVESTRAAAIASAEMTRRTNAIPEAQSLRERLHEASARLAALVQNGASSAEIEAERQARETAERALVRLTSEGETSTPCTAQIDAARLAADLHSGQAAVGFRRFTKWSVEGQRSEHLAAFAVRPRSESGATELIDLGALAPIETAIEDWRDSLGVATGRGSPAMARAASPALIEQGDRVRALVLDPLRSALGDASHLIVVLDDVLHLVPLDALPADPSGGALVGDRTRIEVRATLAELLGAPAPPKGSLELVCVGDVLYDPQGETEPRLARADATPASTSRMEGPLILRGGAWSSGFAPLRATRGEIDGLEQLFGASFGADGEVDVLARGDARKSRVVQLTPRARFLHIATHGWFAPESVRAWNDPEPLDKRSGLGVRQTGEDRVKGMSPLLLCGLALAGANVPEDEAGRAHGLITAEEISTLDLANCELAVLSACDTNVGERRAGQGVASLQKALQMAGARSVITSSWKVPDEATKDLMLDFYRRMWVEKKPKWQALWEAKSALRNAKDERGNLKYSTRDWAAWVLTGAPD